MKLVPISLIAVTVVTALMFPANSVQAATRISFPTIIQSKQLTAATLQGSKYGCKIVTPVPEKDFLGTLWMSFDYTDGHDTRFIQAVDKGKATVFKTEASGYLIREVKYEWYPNTFSCPKSVVDNILGTGKASLGSSLLKNPVAGIINSFFNFVDGTLTWTTDWLTSNLFLIILQQGTFIQNDMVKQGWPFIQGLTNLGFIFVLLYIALATTLRLESVSTSVQRYIPKLLIAALLVNFSLVIGGLIIDASRLAMAVELTFVGGPDVAQGQLITKVLQAAGTYENVAKSLSSKDSENQGGWQGLLLARLKITIVMLMLTLGLGVVAINLFIRYIVLLVLLIFSPIAYISMILPQTKDYYKQWWGMFIKWVLYGPIVLFFLIIIGKMNSIGLPPEAGWFAYVAQFCVVIALLFVGNSAAKKIAGYGSDAVIGWGKKNPRAAVAGAGLVLAGPLGALAAFAGYGAARNAGRDIYKTAGDNLKNNQYVKPVRKLLGYDLRDEKGNIKTGKSTRISRLTDRLTEPFNTSLQKDIARIKALKTIDDQNVKDAALTPLQLGKGHITSALGQTNIDLIIEHGTQAQRMAIVGNKEYVASLKPEQLEALQQSISNAPHTEAVKVGGRLVQKATGISDGDKTKLLEKIGKTMEDLKK